MRRILSAITRLIVPVFREGQTPAKKVAIVVPLSNRVGFTDDERISLRHLNCHLGAYDRYFLAPEPLEIDLPGFRVKRFPLRYFGSGAAHGKLLASLKFYREFSGYEFILFYHLDSLVLRNCMEYWCSKDIDYIGAPWVRCEENSWVDRPRVGNGGFALLRVSSAIRVLVNRHRLEPSTFWLDLFSQGAPRWAVISAEWFQRFCPSFELIDRILHETRVMDDPAPHGRNNDIFWSDRAVLYFPEFKVASLADGLSFAFEAAPSMCLKMNGGAMPFGCHAWSRYEPEFWEPHLMREPS